MELDSPSFSEITQFDCDTHFLLKTFISSASDLISLVKNLIEILILSFEF